MRVLAAVQFDNLRGREATRLSGGPQQRLALARALLREPARNARAVKNRIRCTE